MCDKLLKHTHSSWQIFGACVCQPHALTTILSHMCLSVFSVWVNQFGNFDSLPDFWQRATFFFFLKSHLLHFVLERRQSQNCSSTVPRADHILAQNLKGRSSSFAAPIETFQPVGDRQNTRFSFFGQTNRHPLAFTKLFTRTDEGSRRIRYHIRFMF